MKRDRSQRERSLVEAVGKLLSEEGFDQLKINKIAQRAGVNKILIYRYFGGLDGLLKAYLDQERPVVLAPLIDVERLKEAPIEEFFDTCYQYLISEFRLLRNNVAAQEILKTGLYSSTDTVVPLIAEREQKLRQMIDELAAIIGTRDGQAFSALLIGGLTMLTFSGQQGKVIFGVDLKTDEGWAKIETALANIFRGAYLYTKERMEQAQSDVG